MESAPGHPGHYLKLSARTDGSFTITNERTGFTKEYPATRSATPASRVSMAIDPRAVAQELIDAYEAGDLLPETAVVARRLRPVDRLRRGGGAVTAAACGGRIGRRAKDRVRQSRCSGEAEARDRGVGVDVRRHGATCAGSRGDARSLRLRAEARAGDRLQAEVAGHGDLTDPAAVLNVGGVAVAGLRDRRLPVSRNGSSSRPISSRRSGSTRDSCSARRRW